LFDIIKESLSNEEYDEAFGCLLIISVKKGYSMILDYILSKLKEMDEISKLKEMDESVLEYCLTKRDNHGQSVLIHVILGQDKDITGTECLDILMKYRVHFDIDVEDDNGNTALHYAVEGNWKLDRTLAKTLIRNGACINVKNKEGVYAMDCIPANTIEDILDACIEEPNGSMNERKNENYEIKMNFSIFSHKETLETRNESDFIIALQNSSSHQHLLYHPLISTFLHIKWQRVSYIWYLNLVVNMIFYFLILFYMFYCRKDQIWLGITDKETNVLAMKIIITIIGSIHMLREIIQLRIFRFDYFQSIDNYIEVSILVLTCSMLYTTDILIQQSMAAWLVLMITVELLLHFEKMHLLKMSLYVSMFRKITFNFVKLSILILWMVIAFGISFYLLIHVTPNDVSHKEINGQNKIQIGIQNMTEVMGEESKRENRFAPTLKDALLKTLIMSTGEFDFSSLDFHYFPASRLLFAVFVFSIFLVGLNLLNGIAISDIQSIQNDASKYHVRDQIECIFNFDNLKPIFSLFGCLYLWKKSQIFDDCFPDKVIASMYPNRHHSTLWVKCSGHKESRFHFLKFYKWFNYKKRNIHKCEECKEIKALLRCKKCGEAKNICKQCREQSQNVNYQNIFRHEYKIPPEFITLAKQIKEELERKDIENKTEKQMSDINERNSKMENRLMNIERNLEDILRYIQKS